MSDIMSDLHKDFTRMNGAPAYVGVLSEVWWRSGWVTPYTMSQLCFDNARACMDTRKAETTAFLLSKESLASTSCLQSHALCILIYLEQEMLCGRVLMMMTWSRILSPQCPHIQADDGSRGDTRPLSPRHPNIFLDLEIFLAESEPRLLCCPQSTLQLQVSVCRSVKERSPP